MAVCVAKALVVVLLSLFVTATAKTEDCTRPDVEDAAMLDKKQLLALRRDLPLASETLDGIRVLLFITTHLPDQHIDFFRQCWPSVLNNSVLLQHADVLLFTAIEPPSDILQDVFRGKRVRVEHYENKGYQGGAELAMEMATTNQWFEGYDWVIRLNPDVLVLDDEWLINNMADLGVDGIFADCLDQACERHCTEVSMLNTDFFAVRPSHLGPTSFVGLQGPFENAEQQATAAFKSIIEDGRDRWIPGTNMHGTCRVHGKTVPVIHAHSVLKQCPLVHGQPENRDIDE